MPAYSCAEKTEQSSLAQIATKFMDTVDSSLQPQGQSRRRLRRLELTGPYPDNL
jgi:hypothetical protein